MAIRLLDTKAVLSIEGIYGKDAILKECRSNLSFILKSLAEPKGLELSKPIWAIKWFRRMIFAQTHIITINRY